MAARGHARLGGFRDCRRRCFRWYRRCVRRNERDMSVPDFVERRALDRLPSVPGFVVRFAAWAVRPLTVVDRCRAAGVDANVFGADKRDAIGLRRLHYAPPTSKRTGELYRRLSTCFGDAQLAPCVRGRRRCPGRVVASLRPRLDGPPEDRARHPARDRAHRLRLGRGRGDAVIGDRFSRKLGPLARASGDLFKFVVARFVASEDHAAAAADRRKNVRCGRGGTRTLTLFRARAPKTRMSSVPSLARV
jgi:hypothetical protein